MNSADNLRHKTIVGTIWTFFEQIFRVGIQTITTIMLAWFLLPEDFGLMAMMAVFFAIGNSLMDSGFTQALIRKKEIDQTDYSTAFYSNLVLGLLAYLLLFVSAPLIASFYGDPRLVVLVRVVSSVIIVNSLQLVQIADLTRKLNFKIQFKIAMLSAIFSAAVAILMAAMDFGIWSLVAQILMTSFTATTLYWIINKWRPSKDFSIESFKEMFGFGSKLFVSGLIDTLFQNMYLIVIGKLFLATVMGYYFFAQKIQQLVVTQLTGVIQKVTYPALSTIQDDNKALKDFYRKIIQIDTYIVFPYTIALIVLAEPLFSFMLKEDWLPAVPYLQLLCIAALLYPLHAINLNILKVKGRSDLFLYLEIIKTLMAVLILSVGVQFGIYGILVGQIISSVFAYIPNSYYSVKMIDYSIQEQLEDFIPTLAISVTMGGFMHFTGLLLPIGGFAYLLIVGSLGTLFYVLTNHLLKIPAQLLLLQLLTNKYFKQGYYDV